LFAAACAGVFYTNAASQLTISNSTLHSNAATTSLGAAAFLYGDAAITDSVVSNNSAFHNGGAIFAFVGVSLDVHRSKFLDNHCHYSGGAIYSETQTKLNFTFCEFGRNRGEYGSVIGSLGDVSLSHCSIHDNAATGNGALAMSPGSSATVRSCTFERNTAVDSAACISADYRTVVSVSSSSFSVNSAARGGAITSAGCLHLDDCSFTDNTASTGGALALLRGSELIADSCSLSGNSAGVSGGAVHTDGALLMRSSSFSNNVAVSGSGGAIAAQAQATVNATGCSFVTNSAAQAGAAVFIAAAAAVAPQLVSSSFGLNTASCCYATGHRSTAAVAAVNGSSSSSSSASSYACTDVDSGVGSGCCRAGEYSDGAVCVRCSIESLHCTSTGVVAATLPLAAGYWRADLQSLAVRQCWREEACKGGVAVQSSDDYCAAGYRGPCELLQLTAVNIHLCALACTRRYSSGTACYCHYCIAVAE
jgi:predicted outer membrane repeat protein